MTACPPARSFAERPYDPHVSGKARSAGLPVFPAARGTFSAFRRQALRNFPYIKEESPLEAVFRAAAPHGHAAARFRYRAAASRAAAPRAAASRAAASRAAASRAAAPRPAASGAAAPGPAASRPAAPGPAASRAAASRPAASCSAAPGSAAPRAAERQPVDG